MNYKEKYFKYKQKYLDYKSKYIKQDIFNYLKEKSEELQSDYNNNTFFSQHDLNQLKIINNFETIERIYNLNNYIELRPYNGEKKLIIGCGNKRLDCGNLDPCYSSEYKIIYDMYHSHQDAYTIDISLIANPSIVSYFNDKYKFNTIPNNSFDLIIFEGGGNPLDNPDEIKRLLSNMTNTFCITMIDGKYQIYSFYLDGDYHIN